MNHDKLLPKELQNSEDIFLESIEQLVKGLGGKITASKLSIQYENCRFLLGKKWVHNEEEGDSYEIDLEIGRLENITAEGATTRTNDQGETKNYTYRSRIYKYVFHKNVAEHLFDKILTLLSKNIVYRVVETSKDLVVYFYHDLNNDLASTQKLMKKVAPLTNGVVHFSQGEWVILNGNDNIHALASSGATECRQYLLYDPITKHVAATHLGMLDDVEVVQEMAFHLKQRGCSLENLQLFASDNMTPEIKRKLLELFGGVRFELNNDYQFDALSGEIRHLNEETKEIIHNDRDSISKQTDNALIGLKYRIPHVLVYESS